MAACCPKKYVRLRFNFCVTNVLCGAFIKHLVDKSLLIGDAGCGTALRLKRKHAVFLVGDGGSVGAADAYNPLEMLVTRQFW